MNVRMIELECDHPVLAVWWENHGFPVVPKHYLPITGIIVEEVGEPLAAGFIYFDNSCSVSMLEWVVTNPANAPRTSLKSIKMLYDFAQELVRERGYGMMLTAIKQPALGRLAEKTGFMKTDEGLAHYLALPLMPKGAITPPDAESTH